MADDRGHQHLEQRALQQQSEQQRTDVIRLNKLHEIIASVGFSQRRDNDFIGNEIERHLKTAYELLMLRIL